MIADRTEKTMRAEPGTWVLRSDCVLTPEGARPAAIVIHGETIGAVLPPEELPPGCPVEDVGRRAVLPGLVDLHVHINEPGRTEWEGFHTATSAAAAGGLTTLVDMPLNSSPVTTTPAALQQKIAAAAGKLWVDCGCHGGLVPDNADRLEPLLTAGVLGVKCFLCPSGIDEFAAATEADLRRALPVLARSGLPLLVHAELLSAPPAGTTAPPAGDPRSYRSYLASRPAAWEVAAIRLLIALCREYRCPIHIVHLAAAQALPLLAEARAEGLPITVETCPHYLCFAAEEIPDGDPRFKCAPPIREAANREQLWEGLRAGVIDTIGSDHSPAPPSMKELATGNLQRAWGGIASLQLVLSAVWTQARQRGFTLLDVAKWMGQRPAQLVGLAGAKGQIAAGADADLVVFDPDATFVVEPDRLWHRHKITPYAGRTLQGTVTATMLRGRKVFAVGQMVGTPFGKLLLRKQHDESHHD